MAVNAVLIGVRDVTQAMFEIEQLLAAAFPWLRFGRFNCRPIGGGEWMAESTPSQHAFDGVRDGNGVGNARDLHGPAGLPLDQQQALLDTVFAYLMSVNDPMTLSKSGGSWNSAAVSEGIGLKRMIWRQPAHFDHIHIDPWPTGHGHPSCSPLGPGVDEYRYSDGTVVATFNPKMEGSLPEGGGMNTEQWVTSLREEDIDRLWALGVHSGDPQHWKDLLETPADPAWETFRTTTQVRLPIWTGHGATEVGLPSPPNQ